MFSKQTKLNADDLNIVVVSARGAFAQTLSSDELSTTQRESLALCIFELDLLFQNKNRLAESVAFLGEKARSLKTEKKESSLDVSIRRQVEVVSERLSDFLKTS